MATINTTPAVNDNVVNLQQYKGKIRKCPLCKPEDALTHRACQLCLGRGFIAMCKRCNGTGQYTGPAVWDGGKTQHSEPCGMCGAHGCFPANRPADWKDKDHQGDDKKLPGQWAVQARPPAPNGDSATLPPAPKAIDGVVLKGGVVVK